MKKKLNMKNLHETTSMDKKMKHEIILEGDLESIIGGNALASCFTCGKFRCSGGFAPSEMQQPSSNPE